jgi:hypothetical protein
MVQKTKILESLKRKICVKTTFVRRNYFSQMPAKEKVLITVVNPSPKITVVNPGPNSDASLTAELEKLSFDEDNDDDCQIVRSFPPVAYPPLTVRGLMVHDTSGEWYAPQKAMFAYNPSVYFQVASVKKKMADVITDEMKKNPMLEVFRFKTVMEKFPYLPTKIGGIDRGYTTKFFPKVVDDDDDCRRKKSPRRSDADEA